ncbi:uncharacterized protein LOC134787198 [Penaeus indicus]|uniref:uncharacterized protein LOC134787198 n=1 Tax=Penaeus indicus TaxID=29960 RepID=UPI00300D57BD
MASAAVARSPTTERLYSLYHKKNIRISLKPKNFAQSSWKPKNNSHTSRESINSTHTEPHTSGKPQSYSLTSLESTNSPHTSREPRNSAHPPWEESHTSENPGSSTLTPWEPRNFTSTPEKPENSTHISGKPRSVADLNPLQTPTKESDQQKEDSASIQEIRHPSARRNGLESIHQEKNADQTLEARLDVMFGKEKNNNYINESLGIPPTAPTGETSRPSESNEEHSNALETVHSLTEESVPTGKYEVNNSPRPNDLILSQSYDLDHLNDVVKTEIVEDYPEARMERSPVLFTQSSGENMCTCSLPHRQTDIDTCSGNLVRDVASQSTSLSDMTGMVGSTNSTRLQKGPKKKKRKRAKRSKSKSGFSRLRANTDAEKTFIETPANGYYLIVRHAIEECPICYTEFCPTRFTVNINTYLLTTVCTGCDLTIYIIFDPPDGSAPKISIETK